MRAQSSTNSHPWSAKRLCFRMGLVFAFSAVPLLGLRPVKAGEPPFYVSRQPENRCYGLLPSPSLLDGSTTTCRTTLGFGPNNWGIEFSDLYGTAPARTPDDANGRFTARAAQAIFEAAGLDPSSLVRYEFQKDGICGAEDCGIGLLANIAYGDYFDEPATADRYRNYARDTIRQQRPGVVGTNGDYDMTLQMYLTIVYKYYRIDPPTSEFIIDKLLTIRGPMSSHESEWRRYYLGGIGQLFDIDAVIPETENHLLMIETARYLTNQLLYRRPSPGYPSGHDPRYDNRRNGNGDDIQATAVWLLNTLHEYLRHDFLEYNARPYQDMIMFSLLNLADYAYDDDVRLAARMVLDYVSAKVAVSSNDLRRANPFRRRNELNHYGPTILGDSNFLGSPLVHKFGAAPDGAPYDHDPQIAWYAQYTGSTDIFAIASPERPVNKAQSDYAVEMLYAGIHDYRVPSPILDLFMNPSSRHFYQSFSHDADYGEMAYEIYASSPSYLITAGGNSTASAYQMQARLLGVGPMVGKSFVGYAGEDSGVALPTTLLPTHDGLTLSEVVQIDTYSTSAAHLGVAPDFACGRRMYVPPSWLTNPTTDRWSNWTFINRTNINANPFGYFLALYKSNPTDGLQFVLMEVYDTWPRTSQPPGLTFEDFKQSFIDRNWQPSGGLISSGIGTYVTLSGRQIAFTVDKVFDRSAILSVSQPPSKHDFSKFADGTILQSEQGSAKIVIECQSPGLGNQITLDSSDKFHPTRTSEQGEVERAGQGTNGVGWGEVWVEFESSVPEETGEYYRPIKTLAKAAGTVIEGGTVRIMPGSSYERQIVITKKMTLTSFPGSATIGPH